MSRRRTPLAAAWLSLAVLVSLSSAAPHPALDYTLTPEKLDALCTAAVEKAKARLDAIAAQTSEQRGFQDTLLAMDLVSDDLGTETSAATFLKYVSTVPEVREAGHACETKVEKFSVESGARQDLYAAAKAAAAKGEALEGEDARLVEKTLQDFRRNGLDLAPVERERVKILKQQLVDLELAYGKNLNEVKDSLGFTREELDGAPADFLDRLEKLPDGKLKVTLDYPDYFPFMENVKSSEARRKLATLYQNRAYPQNTPLLEEALRLRHRIARAMGYADHAAYTTEVRMAKTPEAVAEFLRRVKAKLDLKAKPELDEMLAMKRKDDPKAQRLESWDYLYYTDRIKKARFEIDDEKVKEYFPMEKVTEGMLALYQDLLGLRYKEVLPAEAWHPDVRLFEVRDAADGRLMGHFYMDLYPRDGKYKHAAAFTLVGGRREADGTYRTPVASIVANFNKPTASAPSLLKHDEVETFFHEFGHIMHQVLTQASRPRFAGTRVARDFVEAPSQMLENWVWDAGVLKKISGHYKDPSKKLPDDLLKRMVEAKNLNSGLRYLRQVFYATVDQTLHAAPESDADATYNRLYEEITLFPAIAEGHPASSFGHLMGGYDASYYGYLWSEVYSADMFARFEREGILNPALGLRYRKLILEPGGGRDESVGLKEFLCREPGEDAFLKSIGLGAAAVR